MTDPSYMQLSKRERQIMDIIYARGRATAVEVMEALDAPPSYSAVRAKLRILEEKGYLVHEYQGPSYVYMPVLVREKAQKSVLNHMLQTFFDGSVEKAMTALINLKQSKLTEAEKERLSRLIEETAEKPAKDK
jgi:BlaI family penicillinase repressor